MPFCGECGAEVPSGVRFCGKCGAAMRVASRAPAVSVRRETREREAWERQAPQNWTTLLILSILLGGLGADRFYAGKIGTGLLKLFVSICSLGMLCWIWWLIDIILIATGKFTNSNGQIITQK